LEVACKEKVESAKYWTSRKRNYLTWNLLTRLTQPTTLSGSTDTKKKGHKKKQIRNTWRPGLPPPLGST